MIYAYIQYVYDDTLTLRKELYTYFSAISNVPQMGSATNSPVYQGQPETKKVSTYLLCYINLAPINMVLLYIYPDISFWLF